MRLFINLVCLGAAVALLSTGAFAATYYVPEDYSTIQSAINAADPNGTITVSPGTYYENIHFNGKDIILTSTDPENPNVVEDTIIDGNDIGRVVTFSGSETSACKLSGFTIRNGYAPGSYPDNRGGGIHGNGAQAVIEYCAITGNMVMGYGYGGGLYLCDGSITNCVITGNTAGLGGGLTSCNGPITNCTITANTAGQGLYQWDGGGLAFCDGSITNCTITANTANDDGGGLYDCDGSITNCTITGNTAGWRGGGMYSCDGTITNCIIWENSAVDPGDQLYYGSTPTYTCIQDWNGGGTGNITSDPLFADVSSADPNDWDLHLVSGSLCIDTGTNSPAGGLPATDIEGNPRIIDGDDNGSEIVDMGAYELPEIPDAAWLHITPGSLSFSDREACENPPGQTVTVWNWGNQPLNWSADLTNKPDWLTVTPTSGTLSHTQSDTVTVSVDITGLSGGLYSYAFQVSDPAAQNSPQTVAIVLLISKTIRVPSDYSTIQAAINAAYPNDTIIVSPGTYYENINFNGKNIILISTDPAGPNIVESTIISGDGNAPTIQFSDVAAQELHGFTITHQPAVDLYIGSGVSGGGTSAIISNCIIMGNQSGYDFGDWIDCGSGGGISNFDGLIVNCIIVDNAACYGGGLYNCDGIISNCTIVDNLAFGYNSDGGGLAECDAMITNCIVWGNNASTSGDQLYGCSVPTYSCIQDWTGGIGNISVDPLFVNVYNDDYHLKSEYGRWSPNSGQWVYDTVTSPCIDAGDLEIISYWDPNGTPSDPNDDFLVEYPDSNGLWTNELWPHGGRINMGAYGGTPQASMSANPIGNIADLDHDDAVTFSDFGLFARNWQVAAYLLDTDFDLNGVVDINDLMEMCYWWLWEQGPILDVSETLFSHVVYETGPDPDPNILTISNSGGQTLNWSIDDSGKPDWLLVTPTSGSLTHDENEPVTLTYNISGLPAAQYSYSFEVSDPAANNSPQTITVNLQIYDLIEGLITHWKFDGDATDASGNGYHGTIHDDPNWIAEGIDGGAIQLDPNDYISVPAGIINPASGPFSTFTWVKGGPNPDQTTGIISQVDDSSGPGRYWLAVNTGSLWTALRNPGDSGLSTSVPWNVTAWHHVGIVWDGSRRHLYIDGTEVVADSAPIGSLEACTGALYIGTNKLAESERFWDGFIDDVRIYDRALSEQEVADLYGSY